MHEDLCDSLAGRRRRADWPGGKCTAPSAEGQQARSTVRKHSQEGRLVCLELPRNIRTSRLSALLSQICIICGVLAFSISAGSLARDLYYLLRQVYTIFMCVGFFFEAFAACFNNCWMFYGTQRWYKIVYEFWFDKKNPLAARSFYIQFWCILNIFEAKQIYKCNFEGGSGSDIRSSRGPSKIKNLMYRGG